MTAIMLRRLSFVLRPCGCSRIQPWRWIPPSTSVSMPTPHGACRTARSTAFRLRSFRHRTGTGIGTTDGVLKFDGVRFVPWTPGRGAGTGGSHDDARRSPLVHGPWLPESVEGALAHDLRDRQRGSPTDSPRTAMGLCASDSSERGTGMGRCVACWLLACSAWGLPTAFHRSTPWRSRPIATGPSGLAVTRCSSAGPEARQRSSVCRTGRERGHVRNHGTRNVSAGDGVGRCRQGGSGSGSPASDRRTVAVVRHSHISGSSLVVTSLHVDREGSLWIGTSSRRVSHLRRCRRSFRPDYRALG